MAKSDVEMEGTKKKSQDVENTEVVDGQQSSDSLMEHQDSAKAETEDQRAKSPTPAENGNEEQETANNMVESESNVNDQAVDQTDSTIVVEGSSDAKNAASETGNPSDTIGQSDTQGNKVGDDQNRSGIESLDQNSAMGGIEGEIEFKKKEGDLDADVAVKNEEPIENSADHDTRGGNVLLHEEVPADEVGESVKEVKEFHQNGNDTNVDERKEGQDKTNTETVITDSDAMLVELPETKDDVNNIGSAKMPEPATPNLLMKSATIKAGQHTDEEKMAYDEDDYEDGDDEGTPEAQAAFMRELESFYRGRAMEFKPPKFYGNQLNCLKLWRSVIRLGGYDRVTGSKLWRQVGESFNPPKTCTTVSWTFRIFYEKALLEYERHRIQSGELQLPIVALPEAGADHEGNGYQATGSGRARRDAAARAMQGWHEQRLLGYGEVGEPIIKDKNANSMLKREKNLKSISSLKHKRPNEVEQPAKVGRTETFKQLVTTVVDLGPPADWVKINVRETEDCFEVYALVPGLLREEVRVQSDPAGRLVITGQPEQLDNPWGITAFKKVVSLPGRIDPLQTSATVSLHGRLSVRVPFAQ